MEFVVVGAPRSANANPRSRRRWRERVAQAARERLREDGKLNDQDVAVLIIYFYHGETTLDINNLAKSLLDGLKGVLSATIDRYRSFSSERPAWRQVCR
jgi:hypothetical protein